MYLDVFGNIKCCADVHIIIISSEEEPIIVLSASEGGDGLH